MAHRVFVFAVIATVAAACEDPEAYYRNIPVMTGAAGRSPTGGAGTGAAGTTPFTGAAGTSPTGAAGTKGAAGTSGAAGSSSTGTGAAGTGAAGTGAAGTGAAGTGAASSGSCVGCRVSVLYTCLTDASDAAGFIVEAQNKGSVAFLLGDLTLRYWFTADADKEQELNCDVARLECSKISSSSSQPPVKFTPVTPPRPKANTYVEIKFPAGALDVGGTTGNVQLRLHNKDYSPMNQSDDYSADCGSKNNAHDSGKVTAYLKGVLVGGTEP